MKTIDLTTQNATIEEILHMAEGDNVLVRAAEGKMFAVAEVSPSDADDDFAQEVSLTRRNKALRAFLSQRSQEAGQHTLDQVRQKLGISGSACSQ